MVHGIPFAPELYRGPVVGEKALHRGQRSGDSLPLIKSPNLPRSSLATNGAAITTFETDSTDQDDLRGGRTPWFAQRGQRSPPGLAENIKCDALVIGAGIAGSLIAQALSRQGLDVVIIDRELPSRGSTAAST